MKKFMKKAEGFTLVELIVVIAILGILAGVAIPAYSGYMKKANAAADETTLASVKTACTAVYATAGTVSSIKVEDNAITVNGVTKYTYDTTDKDWTGAAVEGATGAVAATDAQNADMTAFLPSGVDLKYYTDATWNGTAWTGTEPTGNAG